MSEVSSLNLLTDSDVAKALHVSVRTLRRWRALRKGPVFIRPGKSYLCRPSDLAAYYASQARDPSERSA